MFTKSEKTSGSGTLTTGQSSGSPGPMTTATNSLGTTSGFLTRSASSPDSTTPIPCPNYLMLLLDDSIAIPDDSSFSLLKNWTVQKLLAVIPSSISIDAISYDNKQFNDMNGGSFLSGSDTANLVNDQYYHTKNPANISKALQKACALPPSDGSVATLLISASFDSNDVLNARQFSTVLKQNGALLTLLVGSQGNGLQSLASGSGYSFSSAGYAPDDSLLYQLVNTICPGMTTSAHVTTTAKSTATQTPFTVTTTFSQGSSSVTSQKTR